MSAAKSAFDPSPPDPRIEMTLRPALLDQFVGQLRIKERLDVLIDAAKQREDSLEHLSSADRPASAKRRWPTSSPKRWREHHHHFRPRDRKGGRPRRASHHAAKGRRPLHRRNPSPQQKHRGVSLPRDGGFPPRHHHRPRAQRAQRPAQLPRFTLIGATTRAGMISSPLRSASASSTGSIIIRRRFAKGHPALGESARITH